MLARLVASDIWLTLFYIITTAKCLLEDGLDIEKYIVHAKGLY